MGGVSRLLPELPFDERDERTLEDVGTSLERAGGVAGEELVRGVDAHGRGHAAVLATSRAAQIARGEPLGRSACAVDVAGVDVMGELSDGPATESLTHDKTHGVILYHDTFITQFLEEVLQERNRLDGHVANAPSLYEGVVEIEQLIHVIHETLLHGSA